MRGESYQRRPPERGDVALNIVVGEGTGLGGWGEMTEAFPATTDEFRVELA